MRVSPSSPSCENDVSIAGELIFAEDTTCTPTGMSSCIFSLSISFSSMMTTTTMMMIHPSKHYSVHEKYYLTHSRNVKTGNRLFGNK